MRSTRFRLHVGIGGETRKGGEEGEKGVEGKRVAVCVLGGRFGRVPAGVIPSGGTLSLSCPPRSINQSTSLVFIAFASYTIILIKGHMHSLDLRSLTETTSHERACSVSGRAGSCRMVF